MGSKKADKEIVNDILNIVYTQKNLELLKNYIHDDSVFQMAGYRFPAGSDSVIQMYSFIYYAYPNLKYEILEQFENEGRVCTHYRTYNDKFSFFIMVMDYVVDSKIKKSIFTIDPIKSSSGSESEPSFDLLTIMQFSSSIVEKNAESTILNSHLPSENYLQNLEGRITLWERLGFIEDMTDLVVVLNSQAQLVYANNRLSEMMGYTNEEVAGLDVFDFVYEEDRPMAHELFRQVLSKEKAENYFEIRNIKKNGDIIWLGETISVIGKDDNLKVVLVARDITQRKTEDDALRNSYKDLDESERKYRELIESMQLGLVEWDEKGCIINVNLVVCTTLGYHYKEVLNSEFRNLVSASSLLQFSSRDSLDFYPSRDNELIEIELITKAGDSKWFLAHFKITEYEGQAKAGTILIEITDRILLQRNLVKAREDAQRSKIAQDKYTANLSHEIRTPLSAIIGNVELLEDKQGCKESKELLNDLKFASNHLISLLDEVLDLSKFEADEGGLKYEKISIANIFNFLLTSFRKQKVESVVLKSQIDNAIPDTIYGSRLHITQALLNLVGNAVKFTAKGEIVVTASLVKEEGDDIWLEFKVKDTGIGINSESIQEIFLDFKQVRKDAKSNQGVGLGLPISKKLVEMLGGTLEVSSLPFEGTTFSFTIPLKKNIDCLSGLRKNKSHGVLNNHAIRALILEDNILNAKFMARLLETLNVEFSIGFSGWEGLSLLQHRKFEIVFTDYRMPDMDGFEFTRRVRSSSDWYADIPIIAFSASNEEEIRKFGVDAGITDFIRKPFKRQELIQLLNEQIFLKNAFRQESPVQGSIKFPLDFNDSLVHDLYGQDYELMNSMLKTSLTMTADDISELNHHHFIGDYDGIKNLAHKLKSSFNLIGLDQIGNKLSSIEEMVSTANTSSLNSTIDQFNFLYQKSIGSIKLASERIGKKINV
jgi:PAS domain S-box-containing protein